MTDIAELGIKIEAKDIRSAVRELDRLERKSDKAEKSTKKLTKATDMLRGKMGALITVAGAIGFARLTKDAIQYADTIAKTADKLGVTTDALQEYRFAAERSGVAQTALDMGLQRFSRRLGEADKGTGELKGTLQDLGISTRDSAGNIRSAEDVLQEYANAIRDAEGDQEKLRLAFKAFDSEGAAMVNMLRDGESGLNALREAARDAGIVMDANLIRKAEIINDKWDTLTQTIGTKLKTALINIADVFVDTSKNAEKLITLQKQLKQLEGSREGFGGSFLVSKEEIQEKKDEITSLIAKMKEVKEEKEQLKAGEGLDELGLALQINDMLIAADAEKLRLKEESLEAEAEAKRQAYGIMMLDQMKAHEEELELDKATAQAKQQIAMGMLGNLSALMSSESKRLFEVGKAAAVASALIKGYESVLNSYAAGSKIGGPVLGAAYAATAGIATAVQIDKISNSKFSGQAHSGLDNVPNEGTYLLQKGEMVLDAGTSEAVRQGVAGGNTNVYITAIDTQSAAEFIARNGAEIFSANAGQMYENGLTYG